MVAKGLRYLRSNVLGALALFLALGGTGFAATGGFSRGGTLKACVNEEGRVKLLTSAGHCKRGQSVVSWNQVGPQGAKGTPGAAGVPGTAGAPGPRGADGESASVKWAVIGGHAELGAARGVVAAQETAGHFYEVTFDSDITNCAITATASGTVGLSPAVAREGTEVTVRFITYFKGEENTKLTDFSIVAYC